MSSLRKILFLAILICGTFYIYQGVRDDINECSLEANPSSATDPNCARKRWGEEYYYVTRKIYDAEVLPFEIEAERFNPGSYFLTTSNNEVISFTVTHRQPFYCGKVNRYLYNRVTRNKPIRLLSG